MGYASYIDDRGRPAGYAERGICDWPGCTAEIWKGVDARCGAGEHEGCGDFFCDEHILGGSICRECAKSLCTECDTQCDPADLTDGLCPDCLVEFR